MIVYHGSSIEVPAPDVCHSRENVDFGKGFYVTPIKEQANKWAGRFKRHKGKGIVSSYGFKLDECKECYRTLELKDYNTKIQVFKYVYAIRN